MSRSSFQRMGAGVLAIALCMPAAQAQDAAMLKRENARLNAELAQLRNQCRMGDAPANNENSLGVEQRVGDLGFSLVSLRPGNNGGKLSITLTVKIRNFGTVPVALNYNANSFELVDDFGYAYTLVAGEDDAVSGMSTAFYNSAGTDDILLPGDAMSVTFAAARFASRGQTIGNRFDLNTTFGAYEDRGQGRVQRVRNYAVAFVGVSRSVGAQAIGESARQNGKNVVDGVLKGLFGNRN